MSGASTEPGCRSAANAFFSGSDRQRRVDLKKAGEEAYRSYPPRVSQEFKVPFGSKTRSQCQIIFLAFVITLMELVLVWTPRSQEGTVRPGKKKKPLIFGRCDLHASDISTRIFFLPPRVSNLDSGCMCYATPASGRVYPGFGSIKKRWKQRE